MKHLGQGDDVFDIVGAPVFESLYQALVFKAVQYTMLTGVTIRDGSGVLLYVEVFTPPIHLRAGDRYSHHLSGPLAAEHDDVITWDEA